MSRTTQADHTHPQRWPWSLCTSLSPPRGPRGVPAGLGSGLLDGAKRVAGDCAIPNGDKNSAGDRMGRLQFLHHSGARHWHLMTVDKRARQERSARGGGRNPTGDAGGHAGPGHAPARCTGERGLVFEDRVGAEPRSPPGLSPAEPPTPGNRTQRGFCCTRAPDKSWSPGTPRGWGTWGTRPPPQSPSHQGGDRGSQAAQEGTALTPHTPLCWGVATGEDVGTQWQHNRGIPRPGVKFSSLCLSFPQSWPSTWQGRNGGAGPVPQSPQGW